MELFMSKISFLRGGPQILDSRLRWIGGEI
jgi:hypothetical protein